MGWWRLARRLDCIGPMGHSVEDVARLLQVMAGHDPKDSTTMPTDVPDYLDGLNDDLSGMKIGVPQEYFSDAINDEVKELVLAAIEQVEELGAETVSVSMPHTDYCLATYYILATSEASSNLARYDGIRFGQKVDRGEMWDTYRATRGLFRRGGQAADYAGHVCAQRRVL